MIYFFVISKANIHSVNKNTTLLPKKIGNKKNNEIP